MLIDDILREKGYDVFKVKDSEIVCDVMKKLSERKMGSCIVINDQGDIRGIMTERDVLQCHIDGTDATQKPVKEIMTPAEKLIVGKPENDIQYAIAVMTENRIKHLPIFKNLKLIGIISQGDILRAQLDHSRQVSRTYLDYLAGRTPQPENLEY